MKTNDDVIDELIELVEVCANQCHLLWVFRESEYRYSEDQRDYFKALESKKREIRKTILEKYRKECEERVREERERIFGDIEQFKSEVVTMGYCEDFKDGIYATIEHILSMPCFESVLTPTKTDKQTEV